MLSSVDYVSFIGFVLRQGECADLLCKRVGPQHAAIRGVPDCQEPDQGCQSQPGPRVPGRLRLQG